MKEVVVTIVLAAILAAALFGVAAVQWWDSPSTAQDDLSALKSRPILPFTPLAEDNRFHGVAVQWHNSDKLDQFRQSISEVAATGADTVLLAPHAYQENGSSSIVSIDLRKAPTREQMVDMIRLAKSLRLRVIVMPILLLENARGSEWRGRIVPTDPERWWADYREYIKYYARAATEGGADLLMVGSELNKMESSVERWHDLIRFLREQFPSLKLGYSANWDRYWKVRFWEYLDFAGVTSYYTLADHESPTPTVDEIVGAWNQFGSSRYKDRLIEWQRTIGKPVIFTEVGWYSRRGVATEPWNYYHNEGKPSAQEQANLYEAFLKVWADQPMLGGVIFWEWSLDRPTDPKTGMPVAYDPGTDEGYMPKGKPAEQIMRDYFRTAHATTQPAGGEK